uniref:ADP-ribosyl cyclase/cyclic ADP-ribose hydrolase n=1 Tax=Populus trichocarpa TaxID=3694 RepID=A0A3N7G9A5_POPTR|eukprot:XP_024447028.1 protein SUPPRESSOR OF npr1-1, CONSTITUTIVE 1 isoform X2 [Populus trichocarpa]
MVVFFLFLNYFLFVYIWRFIIRSRHVSPSPSTTSTLTTAQPQVIKYHDVFLSFRGEDTRLGFTSHLHAALDRKQILTFIDDQLERGDEISASLLRTIEEAKLSVIVFSANYASSKWCLEELVKIFECRKNNGQIVFPVFYKVDPTHVRNLTGSFGGAFARLIRNKALTLEEVQSFRDALTDAASLSGWNLGNSELEAEFIEKIVGDVLGKLHAMSSSHTMAGLFGIDVRVSKVESLLNMESPDVLIVGIWGMGGIGKTTIAKAVRDNMYIRSRFDRIFYANFRQKSDLRRKFLKQLLGQETLGSLSFRDSFVRERLSRIKILIVLDDVHNLMHLEEWRDLLDGRNNSFGPGSKVLITSRDKQVLNNVVDENKTYKVKELNYEEAIQLFRSNALKNCIPTIDQMHMIEQIPRHVQGNPLALKVLGSSFYGKSMEVWRSALNKLDQNRNIKDVLRISYDGLDSEQQSIFLDIAHFFINWNPDEATRILDCLHGRSVISDITTLIDNCLITNVDSSCDEWQLDCLYGRSVNFDIYTLLDQCLVNTSHISLEMHDLLREMAFNIVRAESRFPGKRSRLCHPPDVVQVLEENKGTEEIEGISLDMSKLSRQIHLKSDAFAMMDGLRFLNFYGRPYSQDDKMHLPPPGLKYLPNKLRYLRWDGFPSKSLPPFFRAEHLVELHLRESKLVKLWTGVKDVGNLRTIDLSKSSYLTELPDLSMAKNLVSLRLKDCPSLTEVPSSLQYLDKLEYINLRCCYNLRSFPMLYSKVLRKLSIDQCLDLTTCPTISQNMKSLRLWGTSIKEVPQSITGKLKVLDLWGCSKMTKFPEVSGDIEELWLSETAIQEVPSSIQFLTRLRELEMNGCSKLESLPEITVPMESLEYLGLSETGIKELPSSIQSLTRLRDLDMSGCSKLESLPEITVPMESLVELNLSKTGIKELPSISFKHMTSLKILKLDGTPLKELPSSIQFLTRLQSLDMSGCSKLESFPQITVPMESLAELNLSKTGIKELPLSIKDMVCLKKLTLEGTPIKELPLSIKDMVCLEELTLHGTPIKALPDQLPPSLRYLRTRDCSSLETVPSIIDIGRLQLRWDFTNCFKVDQKPLIEAMHLKIQSGEEIPRGGIEMVIPGSEIPEWFGDKGVGSSLTIQLPSNRHQLKGIAFCLVFLLPPPSQDLYCDYHVKYKNGEHDAASRKVISYKLGTCDSDHMILQYRLVNQLREYSANEVTFKFYLLEEDSKGRMVGDESRRPFELKSWGVYLHFDENLPADTDLP